MVDILSKVIDANIYVQHKVPQADFILLTCSHMSCRSHCSGEECPVEGCNAAACALNHLLTPIGVRGNSDIIIDSDSIINPVAA
jgi:hypothetical protein